MKSIRKQLEQLVYFFSLSNGIFCSHVKRTNVTQSLAALAYFSPKFALSRLRRLKFILAPTPYLRSNSVVVVT